MYWISKDRFLEELAMLGATLTYSKIIPTLSQVLGANEFFVTNRRRLKKKAGLSRSFN